MIDIKIRRLVITIFFFIIFYFNDSYSVHHHKRLTFNYTQGTEFFWKNRPLAKVFHGMIKSYLFLELATVVKRSLSEIAVRQHSRSETASK